MSDNGSDQDKPKLRSVPRDSIDKTLREISEELRDAGHDAENITADDENAPVFVRRLEKRLENARKGDRPWIRRIVGGLVILLTFYIGWRMLDAQREAIAAHLKKRAAQEARMNGGTGSVTSTTPSAPVPTPAVILKPVVENTPVSVPLTAETLDQIAECTKGSNPFRQLHLKADAQNPATLESVFAPVLISERNGVARSSLNLQNVRMRVKGGEEWRLHAAPKTQNGALHMKLFRVAPDGLPEEIPFPPELADLADQPVNESAIARFLTLSVTPGQAIEIERHESWSFPEKAGAQVIWSGNQMFDLQVFMKEKFLACSRGAKAGEPQVICKCIDRS